MQVGLASSNDAVVCAAVRVCGSILQSMITHKQWPAQRDTWQQVDCDTKQSAHSQTPGRAGQQELLLRCGDVTLSALSTTNASAQLDTAAIAAAMLSALTKHAIDAQKAPDGRIAALLELQQVALLLADTQTGSLSGQHGSVYYNWLPQVVEACMAALAGAEPALRRCGRACVFVLGCDTCCVHGGMCAGNCCQPSLCFGQVTTHHCLSLLSL